MTDNDILSTNDFNKTAAGPAQSIKVIGVGGGGNNAVVHMFKNKIKDVSFVLINTDRQVLDDINIPTKVLIGPGRGAGGKPERAREYAEESAEKIAELFDDNTDMVFITAGMGGGTGTGAAPVVARIAKEKGILTVGIVTVPFLFEGQRKILKALEGAEEMAKHVDSLLVINNERLTEIYQNLDILNAFAKADDTLLTAAQSITDIITYRGVINRDFNDVDTTLRDGGTAIISTGYGEGPNRVTAAIQDALHSPLLRNTDIFGSKKLLMVLYVSEDNENHPFNMSETEELTSFIGSIDQDVDVMYGLYQAPDLGDKVKITILASGFEVSVDTDPTKASNRKRTEPKPLTPQQIDAMADTYGSGTKRLTNTGRVLSQDSYDDINSDALREIEQTPAYKRRGYTSIHRPTAPLADNSLADNQGDTSANGSNSASNASDSKSGAITFDDL